VAAEAEYQPETGVLEKCFTDAIGTTCATEFGNVWNARKRDCAKKANSVANLQSVMKTTLVEPRSIQYMRDFLNGGDASTILK
jgi:hypothetical protein